MCRQRYAPIDGCTINPKFECLRYEPEVSDGANEVAQELMAISKFGIASNLVWTYMYFRPVASCEIVVANLLHNFRMSLIFDSIPSCCFARDLAPSSICCSFGPLLCYLTVQSIEPQIYYVGIHNAFTCITFYNRRFRQNHYHHTKL